jgi:uncharacterized protein
MILRMMTAVIILAVVMLLITAGRASIERRFLFFPTHRPEANGLAPWIRNGEVIGYSRIAASPRNVWLMLHGNGGQASDRAYALPRFSSEDSVFIMEYPGYGGRKGIPSKEAFDGAAREAYLLLRETYPEVPVCVAGESLGSGPACALADLSRPPDKLVLIVPFDRLSAAASEHVPSFLVRLLLKDNWDNVAALARYEGPVDIFGAKGDRIIPVSHARALAATVPWSKLVIIDGGHNEWPYHHHVRIRNP